MKVCFVAPLADVLFDPNSHGVFGGSEMRAWTLARALARLESFEVLMVVQGTGPRTASVHDGVTIVKQELNAASVRRSFAGQLLCRLRGVPQQGPLPLPDSDIVCAFGAVSFNAQLAELCRRKGHKFVLMIGSDLDVAGGLADVVAGRPLDTLPPRAEAGAAMAAADLVVAQTQWQAQRVERATGRRPAIVPSPVDLDELPGGAASKRTEVLWIGKTNEIKRPRVAIEVARLCPGLRFRIVANPLDRARWDELAKVAPDNVVLVERFPFAQADDIYERALILLNTSAFEGFPSAFLQAGRHGVPVVSAVADPDGFLRRTGSGIVAGPEPAALAAAICSLAEDREAWQRASTIIRDHVTRHHDSRHCAAALARCFEGLKPAKATSRNSAMSAMAMPDDAQAAYDRIFAESERLGAPPYFVDLSRRFARDGIWKSYDGLLASLPVTFAGGTAVDIGCKYGHALPVFLQRGASSAIGVDVVDEYLETGRRYLGAMYPALRIREIRRRHAADGAGIGRFRAGQRGDQPRQPDVPRQSVCGDRTHPETRRPRADFRRQQHRQRRVPQGARGAL